MTALPITPRLLTEKEEGLVQVGIALASPTLPSPSRGHRDCEPSSVATVYVLEGYALVPIEPSKEMVKASCQALFAHKCRHLTQPTNKSQKHAIRLRAAIAAAPEPPFAIRQFALGGQ